MWSVLWQNNLIQIVVRCAAVYLFILLALRLAGKKELAQLSVVDLVFILLISNAVQNAMVGPDTSLQGGLLAAGTLFALNVILKMILYRNRNVSEWIQGKPQLLIYKGVVQHDVLRQSELSLEELHAAIREHGVAKVEDVDLSMLEVDGSISVVSRDFSHRTTHEAPPHSKRKRRNTGRPA